MVWKNKIILFHHNLGFLSQEVYDRHNLKVDDGLKKDITVSKIDQELISRMYREHQQITKQ